MRYRKLFHTDMPSIQGPWTPYAHKNPELNLDTFPKDELSQTVDQEKSATEILLELFEKQELEDKIDQKDEGKEWEIQRKWIK